MLYLLIQSNFHLCCTKRHSTSCCIAELLHFSRFDKNIWHTIKSCSSFDGFSSLYDLSVDIICYINIRTVKSKTYNYFFFNWETSCSVLVGSEEMCFGLAKRLSQDTCFCACQIFLSVFILFVKSYGLHKARWLQVINMLRSFKQFCNQFI